MGWSPWVRDLGGLSGVYLLRDSADHSAMYVGQSRDLRKRIQKHFSRSGRLPFPSWRAEGRVYLLAIEHLDLVEDTLIVMHPEALNRRRPPDAPPF